MPEALQVWKDIEGLPCEEQKGALRALLALDLFLFLEVVKARRSEEGV